MQQRCTSTRAIPSRDAANRDCISCRLHRRHYLHPSPCLPFFRCSDASVSILFRSWTKYCYLSSMISFLFKNLTSLNLLKLLTIWISNFFPMENLIAELPRCETTFFLSHWWPKYQRWSWKGYLMFRFLSVVFLKWGLTNRWTPLRDRWGKYSILSSYLWSKL